MEFSLKGETLYNSFRCMEEFEQELDRLKQKKKALLKECFSSSVTSENVYLVCKFAQRKGLLQQEIFAIIFKQGFLWRERENSLKQWRNAVN